MLQSLDTAIAPYLRKYVRHNPGMLIFAGFLTLGAPYWYKRAEKSHQPQAGAGSSYRQRRSAAKLAAETMISN